MPKITEMWAFISEDHPDDEGIISMHTIQGWMPLVGADQARIESFRSLVEDIARQRKIKVKLVRFSVREDIEEIGSG